LNNQPPPPFFRANALDLTPDYLGKILGAGGVRIEWMRPGEGRGRVLEGDLHRTDLFREGKIVIQDAGSQSIPFLLAPRPGEKILDLCSAPGGKTSEIAWLTRDQAEIFAVDVSFSRLLAAKSRQEPLWKHINHFVADGTQPLPCRGLFDKILVDAPCSGTGTLRRNPDIRWKLEQKKLLELHSRQLLLLENTVPHLRPGGVLVYSTCSLEEEENERVVDIFLNRHPEFHLTMPDAPDLCAHFDSKLFFYVLPSEANADGFFAAVLKKDPQG
jgi:16S rRNA (cytosine967-C5)-methyltransferase